MTRTRIALVVAAVATVACGAWMLGSRDRESRLAPVEAPPAPKIAPEAPEVATLPEPARVEAAIAELDDAEDGVTRTGSAQVEPELRVTVVDREGAPLPDASVFVFPRARGPMRAPLEYVATLRRMDGSPEESLRGIQRSRTDETGWTAFSSLPKGEWLELAAIHPDHGCSGVERLDPTAEVRDAVTLSVVPPIRFRVRVMNGEGAPVPDAWLAFAVSDQAGETMGIHVVLDREGRAEAEIWRAEEIWIQAGCYGFRGAQSGRIVLEDHDVEREIELRLVALDLVPVRGRLAMVDGAPEGSVGSWLRAVLGESELDASPPAGPGLISMILDLRGRAVRDTLSHATGRLDFERDTFDVTVVPEDDGTVIALVARDTVLGWIERDDETGSFAEDPVLWVDPSRLPSSSKLGEIRVRLVDEEDGRSLRAPEAMVWVWGEAGSSPVRRSARFGDSGTSEIDGLIEFGELPFGSYVVGARFPGRCARFQSTEVSDGSPSREVTIELEPADAVLSGFLRLPSESDADASILCYEPSEFGWKPFPAAAQIESSRVGSFVLANLPRRRLVVVAEVEGFAPACAEVDLAAGDARVELAPEPGVRVDIQGAPDRPFDPGCDAASVRIVDEAGRVVVDWAHPSRFRECSHGWARVTLAPGRYTATLFVTEHEPGTADFTVDGATTVRIPLRRRPR